MSGPPVVRLPTYDDVERAARGLAGRLKRTPTLEASALSAALGRPVFLKAELFQETGSFKPRGVLTKLDALTPEERARGVIAASAGNHAAALAFGAARAEIDCLVVMWQGASEVKRAAAERYEAAIDSLASGPSDVFERLAELEAESGRLLVHPFDDPLVLAGQGTVGLELLDDAEDWDVVLVPTGGGGLVAGIAIAVKARRPDARVIAVEPERAQSLGAALEAGRPVPVDPKSIADGLNAPFAGPLPLAVCRELGVEHLSVDDDEIAAAFRFLYAREKLAVEPAGAAGVAALLSGRLRVEEAAGIAIVVSGGNVAPETASGILGGR